MEWFCFPSSKFGYATQSAIQSLFAQCRRCLAASFNTLQSLKPKFHYADFPKTSRTGKFPGSRRNGICAKGDVTVRRKLVADVTGKSAWWNLGLRHRSTSSVWNKYVNKLVIIMEHNKPVAIQDVWRRKQGCVGGNQKVTISTTPTRLDYLQKSHVDHASRRTMNNDLCISVINISHARQVLTYSLTQF